MGEGEKKEKIGLLTRGQEKFDKVDEKLADAKSEPFLDALKEDLLVKEPMPSFTAGYYNGGRELGHITNAMRVRAVQRNHAAQMSSEHQKTYMKLSSELLIADDQAYTKFDEMWLGDLNENSKKDLQDWNSYVVENLHEHRRMALVQMIVNMMEAKKDKPKISCLTGAKKEGKALVDDIARVGKVLQNLKKIDRPRVLTKFEEWIDLHEKTFLRRAQIRPYFDVTKFNPHEEQQAQELQFRKDVWTRMRDTFTEYTTSDTRAGKIVLSDKEKVAIEKIESKFEDMKQRIETEIDRTKKEIQAAQQSEEKKEKEQKLKVYNCILRDSDVSPSDSDESESLEQLDHKRLWSQIAGWHDKNKYMVCGYWFVDKKNKKAQITIQEEVMEAFKFAKKSYYGLHKWYVESAKTITDEVDDMLEETEKDAWLSLSDELRRKSEVPFMRKILNRIKDAKSEGRDVSELRSDAMAKLIFGCNLGDRAYQGAPQDFLGLTVKPTIAKNSNVKTVMSQLQKYLKEQNIAVPMFDPMDYEKRQTLRPVFEEKNFKQLFPAFAPEMKEDFLEKEMGIYQEFSTMKDEQKGLFDRLFKNYWRRILGGLRQEQWHFYLMLEPYFLGADDNTVLKKVLEHLGSAEGEGEEEKHFKYSITEALEKALPSE